MKKETTFPIDPQLELQASLIVSSLGKCYQLEGAEDLNDGYMEVWYKDKDTHCYLCDKFKINYNLFDRKMLSKNKEKQEKKEESKEFKILNLAFFERIK